MIRRILDYFGLAHYDAHPRILRRPDLAVGVNVHADAEWFPEIAQAGFDTVLMDWWPGADVVDFAGFFDFAKKNGLKVFITGFPKDSGPIAERARELFDRHGPDLDFVAVRNEPDLAKFYWGDFADLRDDVVAVWAERQVRAPHVKIVAPCVSSLGSSSRLGVEETIKHLGAIEAWRHVDIIGQHIYRDTPDAVLRYYRHIRQVYRDAGWTQKFFISEFGWRSPKLSQERQAVYVANTMAMLAKEPDICGVGVYVCNDDVAAKDYFGIRGKQAWTRISEALKP